MRFPLISIFLLLFAGFLKAEVELGDAWKRVDDGQSSLLRACVHTGTQYLAVGEAGLVQSSPDGVTWTLREVPTRDQLNAIAWSGSRAVAVGSNATCLVTDNGIDWQRRPIGVNVNLNSVVWTGSRFVAVGLSGAILSSPDGLAWTAETSGTTATLTAVCESSGELVATGSNIILRSTVPGTWTSSTSPGSSSVAVLGASATKVIYSQAGGGFYRSLLGGAWQLASYSRYENLGAASIASNGTAFVAVGTGGLIASSPDGDSWTQVNVPTRDNLISVFWRNSQWEAVSANREILRSADGMHWTTRRLEAIADTAWNGSIHVAVGRLGCIATSANGLDWTNQVPPSWGAGLEGVAWNGSVFVAVGSSGTTFRSADGVNWTEMHLGSMDLREIIWQDDRFLALGGKGAIFASPDGLDWYLSDPGGLDAVVWDGSRYLAFRHNQVLSSTDGNRWRILTTVPWPGSSTLPSYEMRKILWNGSIYIAVGDSGWLLTSPDGITWTSRKPPGFNFASAHWKDVASSGSGYVAVGEFNSTAVSTDGLTWTGTVGTTSYRGVVWGPSKWIAWGDGVLARSDDGVTWTKYLPGVNAPALTGLAAGNGVVLGLGNRNGVPAVLRSTDGITWTEHAVPGSGTVKSAVWNGSAFIATLYDGSFATSPNGQVWTLSPGLAGRSYEDSLWTGTQVLAWSEAGAMATSPDGGSWTHGNSRAGSGYLVNLAAGGGRCVAVEENRVSVNLGGDDWVGFQITPGLLGLRDVCYTGGKFHVIGYGDIFSSADGLAWAEHPADDGLPQGDNDRIYATPSGHLLANRGSAYRLNDASQWVMVNKARASNGFSGGGGRILATDAGLSSVSMDDGLTWTGLGTPTPTQHLYGVVPTADGFLAVGNIGVVYKSVDKGVSWQKLPLNLGASLSHLATDGTHVVAGNTSKLFVTGDNGASWFQHELAPSASIASIEWTGTEFLALGSVSYRSPDGSAWTPLPALNGFTSFKTGASLMVGNQARTAYHGSSLATLKPTPSYNLQGMAYSGTRYVAGMGNPVQSTDGESWATASNSISAQAVVWTGSRFVTVGDSLGTGGGYSADGVTWTSSTGARGSALIWTGNKLFAFDSSGTVRTSPDGAAWTIAMGGAGQPLLGAVWTGSFGVAVGWAGTLVRSADGNSWAPVTPALSGNYRSVAWSGTHLVAVGDAGKIARSTDGLAWQMVSAPASLTGSILNGADLRSVIWTGSQFLIASLRGQIFSSPDGTVWTERFMDRNFWFEGMLVSPGRILAFGRCGALLSSVDGVAWQPLSRGIGSGENSGFSSYNEKFEIKATSGSTFVALGDQGTLLSSDNGKVWNEASYYYGSDVPRDVVWAGDRFLMVGAAGRIYSSQDGRTWNPKSSATTSNLNALAAKGDIAVAVGDRVTILKSQSGISPVWSYASWASDLPPGTDGMEDDPHNSGIPNLLAYAMDFPADAPPSTADRDRLPKLVGSAEIQFLLPQAERAEIRYVIQRSTNLTSWTTVGARTRGVWLPAGSNVISETPSANGPLVRVPIAAPVGVSAFYRLSIADTTGL